MSDSQLRSAVGRWWDASEVCWQPQAVTTASVRPRGSPIERARSTMTERPWRSTSASAIRRLVRVCVSDDSDPATMSPLVLSRAQPYQEDDARLLSNARVFVRVDVERISGPKPSSHTLRLSNTCAYGNSHATQNGPEQAILSSCAGSAARHAVTVDVSRGRKRVM